jgi:predicted nucleic acid-binding protein
LKILVDTDVLLDVALDRKAFVDESGAVMEWCQQTPGGALIAWHTVSNIYYMLRVARSDVKGREFVADLLRFTDVCSGGSEAVRHALTMHMGDFEDALQVAAAISGGAHFVVTRNVADYRNSVVQPLTPKEFLTQFATEK